MPKCQMWLCGRIRGDSDIFLYTPLYFPTPKCKISQLSLMLFNLFHKPTYKLKYIYMQIYTQYSKSPYCFLLTWFLRKYLNSNRVLKCTKGEYDFKKKKIRTN